MLQVLNYPKAYTETLEILKHIEKEEYKKIDKNLINMMEKNKDNNYIFEIKEDVKIEEQNFLQETKTIIAYIYINYLSTEEEKRVINYKLKQDIVLAEKEKQDNFYKRMNPKLEQKNDENIEIIQYNNLKWYQKVFNKIIKYFKNR